MRKNLHWTLSLVLFMLFFGMGSPGDVNAQIFEPEGLNMPGAWNGWTNPPSNLALASSTQVSGGRVAKISTGTPHWQTSFSVAASGGDITGGTYEWLFTSGPSGNAFNNKWGSVGTVTMNSLQNYTLGGSNNSITVSNGKWYTMNWKDVGYAGTSAIFMETSAEPVALSSVAQTPLAANVFPGQSVTVNITASATPCAEEKIYVRYSTDDFVNSTLVKADFTGTAGSATIPATAGTVKYYVFSTTKSSPTADFDLYSIKINNNSNTYYSYTANTSWLTAADGNWSSTSTWQGGVLPLSGQPVTIANNVTLNQPATVSTLTINADKTFTASDGSSQVLTVTTGGALTNNGTFTHGSGKVAFAGTGTITGTLGFYDVDIAGGVNFGLGSTINGTLTINPGGYVNTNAPTYSSGSTLKYNTGGDYGVGTEWKSNTTSGQGVPHHVEIATSNPVRLTGGTYYQLNGNLTINTGKTFQLSTTVGGDLQIKGNLVNNGMLTHQSRLITFNGSSAQEIQGGASTFAYVTIDNAAGVTINNTGIITIANNLGINSEKKLIINPGKSLTVTGSITNSAGDGGLVIESNATGTGSLINNSENVNATVKQYVTPVSNWGVTQDGWHFISSPVAAQSISGAFTPGSNYDFFGFDESTYTWINKKAHPEMTTFGVGKGYLVSYALVGTKAFTGVLNRGDVAVPVTFTSSLPDNQEGWNLVGNPFCSSIDWDGVVRTGVAAEAFYIRNAANDGWSSYTTGVGVNYNNDGHIPPMQGIFVRATGSGNITFPSDSRLHSTQGFTKATSTLPDNIVKLRAVANNQSDEMVLRLHNEATTGFDNSWDASKFISANGTIPQIYSKLNEVSYSINSVEVPEEELIIPVYVQVGIESDVELLQQDNTLLPDLGYAIEDLKTGNRIELSAGSYFFNVSPDDDAHRFNIRLGLKTSIPETTTAIETLTIYSKGKSVYLNSKSSCGARISIYNITGQDVYQNNIKLDGLKQITINAPTGWYIVKVVSSGSVTSKKVFIN